VGDQFELVLLGAKSKLYEIMFNRGKFSCMIMTGMNLVNCELQTARCDVLSFCVSALLLLVAWHAVDVPSQHWCLPKDNGVWGSDVANFRVYGAAVCYNVCLPCVSRSP